MTLTTEDRKQIITKFRQSETDTASPQVQIALMTARLNYLTEHFKKNQKDHHSRRGLMKVVGQRRRLLDYLQSRDASAYKTLITELGIRK